MSGVNASRHPCVGSGSPVDLGVVTKRMEIWARSAPDANGCWEWLAHRSGRGYPLLWFRGREQLAHRVSYQGFHGAIPDGHDVHHICRNRSCVNPEHLQLFEHGSHTSHHRKAA